MAKRKALGQDPLSWINATQKTKITPKPEEEPDDLPAVTTSSGGGENGLSGSFLAIYVINMLLLLILAGLAYIDMGRKVEILATEVNLLRERVNLLEEQSAPLAPMQSDIQGGGR